ncbi:S8 family peptidase [Streptomyces xanthophaeus]|uniref:S8 family peptidase n=1 Tax=Streptomyces xanthophaeus TaxID=67385 RepID=UPI0004CD219F|nr:S8 family peptidase [Streptomyces xanthophaeus]
MFVMRHTRRHLAGIAGTAILAAALAAASPLPASAAGSSAQAQGVVENAGAAGTVPGSYIVILKDSAARSTDAGGRAVVKRYGAKIDRTYSAALNGYSAELTAAQARRLAADPAVKSVVQNSLVTLDGAATTQPDPPSWGLDRIDQRVLPLNQVYSPVEQAGEGVTAYIIDTGVRITHSDFGGRGSDGFDAVDNDNTAQDGNGHGTHVAGTVAGSLYGVAKKAKIVGVRVLDDSGSGTVAQVVAGIEWVTANAVKPAVANMSLGGRANSALDTAVRNSVASGVTYAVAAGNEYTDASTRSPARVAEALTVGATNSSDAKTPYSNYGSSLDLFAPGASIVSAWNSDDHAAKTISGTSMAAPHVAGAAALHLSQHPRSSPAEVAEGLAAVATRDVVTDPGSGSPNRLLYVGDGATPPQPGTRFENSDDYVIADHSTVESPITVSGITGSAPAALRVPVEIRHTWVGDLRVDLVAPDGTVYNLRNHTGGSDDDIVQTYLVDASAVVADGVWKLRVADLATGDTGKIDSWALLF